MNINKNFKIITGILVLLIFSGLACGQLTVGIETPEDEQNIVADDLSETLTSQPQADTAEPTAAATSWMGTAELAPYTLPAEMAGLVYRQNDVIWVVNENGSPVMAASNLYGSEISPDLSQMVYIDTESGGEDIVLRDLNTGATEKLTNSPDVSKGSLQWWPSRPDVLVYNQVPIDQLGPWAGYLGAVNLESRQVIDLDMQSSSYNSFALSPDGRTILYDDAGNPVLYLWDEGISRLNMAGYGLTYENYAAPAWSADGNTMAFWGIRQSSDPNSGASEAAVVLVDLAAGQARELHPHHSVGQRGGPEIAFSPDGRWLALVAPGEEESLQGGPMALWVLALDGSEEYYLGYGTSPVWSPAGDTLLFTMWPLPGTGGGSFQEDAHLKMVVTGEWALEEITPLLGSTVLSWYELP